MFGAAAPEVVRLYKIFVLGAMPVPDFSRWYLLISVVFIVSGGLFALAWGDNKPIKCIYNGLTFPTIISAWLVHPPTSPPR
jgi:hypothetical protein